MTDNLKLELTALIGPAQWRWLMPHAERGALVLVDQDLDLADVGLAIATDDVATVNRWIAEALITKPSPQQLETWQQAADKPFRSLIVQPYVLVQDSLSP
ncbi:MAG TPA: DUF2288 family protein [Leptolyngbyaceae cyanobacterium M65_K2018_010]|nr:DUF2288 family protein [Leptolyngbyaceae cyanobacterium M65_K2018_010]